VFINACRNVADLVWHYVHRRMPPSSAINFKIQIFQFLWIKTTLWTFTEARANKIPLDSTKNILCTAEIFLCSFQTKVFGLVDQGCVPESLHFARVLHQSYTSPWEPAGRLSSFRAAQIWVPILWITLSVRTFMDKYFMYNVSIKAYRQKCIWHWPMYVYLDEVLGTTQ
jgi:hypothetical protein